MTATTVDRAVDRPPAGPRPLGPARLPLRAGQAALAVADPVVLLVLACWIAPALFVAAVSQQSSLPADTVFGRWMHATGWAGPLVVLGFAGTLGASAADLAGRRRRVRRPRTGWAPGATCWWRSARRGGSSRRRHWPASP